MTDFNLDRFIDAQDMLHGSIYGDATGFEVALIEIAKGKKVSHNFWWLFPQLEVLGKSEISKYYGIKNIEEAQDYLLYEKLYRRLRCAVGCLNHEFIKSLQTVDKLKLMSSMTLFEHATDSSIDREMFYQAICMLEDAGDGFSGRCKKTIEILRA